MPYPLISLAVLNNRWNSSKDELCTLPSGGIQQQRALPWTTFCDISVLFLIRLFTSQEVGVLKIQKKYSGMHKKLKKQQWQTLRSFRDWLKQGKVLSTLSSLWEGPTCPVSSWEGPTCHGVYGSLGGWGQTALQMRTSPWTHSLVHWTRRGCDHAKIGIKVVPHT